MNDPKEFAVAQQCVKNIDRSITSTIHWLAEVYKLTSGQQAELDQLDAKRCAIRDRGYTERSVMRNMEELLGVQRSIMDSTFKISRGAAKASKVKARR